MQIKQIIHGFMSIEPKEKLESRKTFIKKTLFASFLSLMSCKEKASKPNISATPEIHWRCVSSYPRSLDTIYGGAEEVAEIVKKMSNGKFIIKVYPAGELVPPLGVFDTVQNGGAEMAHTASYYFTGKHEALAFDTAVPFGLTSRQQNAWLYYGNGLNLIREIYKEFNIINFPGGNTGCQMGGWFKKEIKSLADLKGLKMRIPGLGGKVMSALGVNVQVLAGGDIYPALERGAIDATEWVGPYDDEKLGFYKIAKYYYYPGWWEPGANLTFLINLKVWNDLPEAYKTILTTAFSYVNLSMQAKFDVLNPQSLQRILKHNVILKKFPDDILEKSYQKTKEIMEEFASKDPIYRKIYDSWKQFQKDSNEWFKTAEMSYENTIDNFLKK
ncbi:MAG: TRAP transporter substrate-binding protein [Leptonema sp. (in: bacteria)]